MIASVQFNREGKHVEVATEARTSVHSLSRFGQVGRGCPHPAEVMVPINGQIRDGWSNVRRDRGILALPLKGGGKSSGETPQGFGVRLSSAASNFRYSFSVLFLALGLLVRDVGLAAEPSREYQVKAVFVYNFAQFTDWPPNAFAAPDSPIVIGILGNNPFGDFLQETVRNETVHGRRLVIEHFQRVEEIKNCHILYIGQSEAARLEHDLNVLKGRPVLTVSDIEDAAYRGVMVRMYMQANKVRLRVNLDEVRGAGLNLSSKLLRVAEVVHGERK